MPVMSHPEREPERKSHPRCTSGDKVVAVIGILRKVSANKNMVASIHMVCLKDLSGRGEEGADAWDDLTITDAAVWRIDCAARAADYQQPFDAEIPEQLLAALQNKPFAIHMEDETYQGKTRPKLVGKGDGGYRRYTGPIDPAWGAVATDGERRHAELVEAMARKAAGGGDSRQKGASRWGNTGGGNGTGQEQQAEPSANDFDDSEIPF